MMMRSITLLASSLLFAAGCTISFGTDSDPLPIFPDAGYPEPVADGGYGDASPAADAHPPEDAGWGGWPDAGEIPPDAGEVPPDGGWWIPDASVPPDAYAPDATAYPDAGCAWDDWDCKPGDAGYPPDDDAGYPPDGDAGIPPHEDAGCDPAP